MNRDNLLFRVLLIVAVFFPLHQCLTTEICECEEENTYTRRIIYEGGHLELTCFDELGRDGAAITVWYYVKSYNPLDKYQIYYRDPSELGANIYMSIHPNQKSTVFNTDIIVNPDTESITLRSAPFTSVSNYCCVKYNADNELIAFTGYEVHTPESPVVQEYTASASSSTPIVSVKH